MPATPRFQISHRERALEARTHPGQWTLVRSWEHPDAAERTARSIRDGIFAAYQPPGTYQARIIEGPKCWPHRPWTVYCRYVGGH